MKKNYSNELKGIGDVNLVQVINETVKRMNNDETYKRIYGRIINCGVLHTIFEDEIKRTMNLFYNNAFYHPADKSGLADIVCRYNKKISFEIKCTKRWHTTVNGKQVVSTRWTNGTVQSSTQNFVFVIFALNDRGLLTIENAYFGTFSYNEFKLKCKKGMRISENMVKELCVKII